MKLMISQPMRGKTNEQIREEREELVKQLEAEGHEVVDSVLDLSEGKTPVHYLAKSIEMLADVDGVVFMPGYINARGCRIEHDVAREYGKFIRYVK